MEIYSSSNRQNFQYRCCHFSSCDLPLVQGDVVLPPRMDIAIHGIPPSKTTPGVPKIHGRCPQGRVKAAG